MSQNATTTTVIPSVSNISQAVSKVGPTPIIVHDINIDAKRENARERKTSNAREKYFTLGRGKKSKDKQKLTKLDIGTPSVESFVHVTGVKPSTQGFQMVDNTDQINPLLRDFLQVAGLSESILSNPQQKEEIYRFIEDNNALEIMKKEHRRKTTKGHHTQKPKVAPKPSIKLATTPSFPPPPQPMEQSYRMPSPIPQDKNNHMATRDLPPPPLYIEKPNQTKQAPCTLPQANISAGIPPPAPASSARIASAT